MLARDDTTAPHSYVEIDRNRKYAQGQIEQPGYPMASREQSMPSLGLSDSRSMVDIGCDAGKAAMMIVDHPSSNQSTTPCYYHQPYSVSHQIETNMQTVTAANSVEEALMTPQAPQLSPPHVVDLTQEQTSLSVRQQKSINDKSKLASRRASNPKEPWGLRNQAKINRLIAADHARNEVY